MVTRQEIQATCDDIVREFAPLQVILFGSHAYGTPTEDSDVDLLVVMDIPKSEFRNKAIEIRQRISYRFGLDLLVRSPKEIAYRVSYNDWFLREITEKGELLHGSDAACNVKNLQFTHYGINLAEKGKDCLNPLTLEWIQLLVLVMTGLTFSTPFVSIAQQTVVQTEAATAAEADANKDISKLLCFSAGCVLSALFFLPSPYGYFSPPTGIIGAYSYRPSPPPSRLIGKSPEYIAAYTSAYQLKRGNIQARWTSVGCLSGCVILGTIAVGINIYGESKK